MPIVSSTFTTVHSLPAHPAPCWQSSAAPYSDMPPTPLLLSISKPVTTLCLFIQCYAHRPHPQHRFRTSGQCVSPSCIDAGSVTLPPQCTFSLSPMTHSPLLLQHLHARLLTLRLLLRSQHTVPSRTTPFRHQSTRCHVIGSISLHISHHLDAPVRGTYRWFYKTTGITSCIYVSGLKGEAVSGTKLNELACCQGIWLAQVEQKACASHTHGTWVSMCGVGALPSGQACAFVSRQAHASCWCTQAQTC